MFPVLRNCAFAGFMRCVCSFLNAPPPCRALEVPWLSEREEEGALGVWATVEESCRLLFRSPALPVGLRVIFK